VPVGPTVVVLLEIGNGAEDVSLPPPDEITIPVPEAYVELQGVG